MHKLSVQYLIHTFFIMVLCWGTCLLCSICGIYFAECPVLYIPYLLGGFSPTIAAYAVQKKNGTVCNFREWITMTFDFKHNVFSYALLPVFSFLFFFCLCSISGYESGAPIIALVFMVPMMLFGGGMEEAGWRGVLQPELEEQFGYTIGTILVAVIWWLWHLPLFFINGVSQYGADFLSFGINVLGLSFALSATKKITHSTWLCILFHCIINSLHGVYIVEENIIGDLTASAILILFSYIFLWIQKRKQIFI